jgi:hypothetical protein
MATSKASGSQTAVITTEHTLSTVTDAGTYALYVDTNAMVLGDILELRVKYKATAAGTTREFMVATYAHVQGQPVKASIPVASINECVFTLKQTAGTGRAFPWEVVEL